MLRPAVDASVSISDTSSSGELRLLAADLLARTLVRLGRAGTLVDRRLTPALARMHGRRLYRLLGYVRLADYLTERLGMSLRRCQAILRLERALANLPRLARAFGSSDVSISKLEVIAPVATPDTEETWLDRAKRLPLPALRETASAALPDAASAALRQAAPDDRPTAPSQGAPDAPDSAAPAVSTGPCPTPIEGDEPGRIIVFNAPASVLATWHWTLDLVRRVAGRQEPAWRCAEYLAAEFLSGVPDPGGAADVPTAHGAGLAVADGSAHRRCAPDHRAPGPDAPSRQGPALADAASSADRSIAIPGAGEAGITGMRAWTEACDAVREALGSIGAAADPDTILAERETAAEAADAQDAWQLDARLRGLVRLRQSLAWRQGRLLATFASLGLHRDLGFPTFDDWVAERLPMSPRRARYLISLDRRLRDLPLLADAYRRGLVSWCQARLLVKIVHPTTQSRWIRYARQVTVRRLEDAIIECESGATTSPASIVPAHVGASPPGSAAHIGALASSLPGAPAHIGASASSLPGVPAHIGALPLPPSEPSPGGEPPPSTSESSFAEARPADPSPARPQPAHASPDALPVTASNPQPSARRRISFWCPLDVASLWDGALRACRAASGPQLEDWECFLLMVQALRDTWENHEDPYWRRRYRIFERDNWRCKAPGCTSRSGLNEHHIVFRSRQGGNERENLVTLCVGHHQQGVHAARIRCFGQAPDGLWWDLGIKPGGEPLARYFGDRVVVSRPSSNRRLCKPSAPCGVPVAETASRALAL